MGLSNDLLSQFAKITKDNTRIKKESTVYGTVKEYDSKLYVQLDGSDLLTPIATTTDMKNGERVVVQIKDHSATILGNMSSPSATSENLTIETTRIDNLEVDNMDIYGRLDVAEADITKLKADIATVENLEAINAKITNLETTKLNTYDASITYATITNLDALNGKVTNLETTKLDSSVATITYATIENLNATNARIDELDVDTLNGKYANIDFSNIGMAAVEKLFTQSGIIKDLVVNDTNITGELVGVTIKGDLIEGNTIVADKLVVQGEDGLYYKLNTDGIKVESEQTDYNSLNGSVITTKSITANKINVSDLVAFGATIGGFKLTENSIYSGVKTTIDNTTSGIYLDNEGQINFGDASNFVKYYKDQNGNYKLEISADTINVNSESITARLTDLQTQINRISERIE